MQSVADAPRPRAHPLGVVLIFYVIVIAALAGCASNPYAPWYKPSARYEAYEHYKPTPVEMAQMRATYNDLRATWPKGKKLPDPDTVKINPHLPYRVTDVDAVNYANHVRSIFTAKFTNARFARYTGATTQVLLAGGAGVAAIFSGGTSVIAGLAFGSAVTPEIAKIFNAKGRANVYRLCALQIDTALDVYAGKQGGEPNPNRLTEAGRSLLVSTYIAIQTAELHLDEALPSIKSAEEAAKDAEALAERVDALVKPKPAAPQS